MQDGTYTGVVDRIVDGEHAVFEVTDDGEFVDELVVDVETLPEEVRYEGAMCRVEVVDDALADAEHRPEAERERRERVSEKLDRLTRRQEDLEDG